MAETARALRQLRHKIIQENGWSLRELYKSLETPGEKHLRDAHAALNTTVRRAYGMNPDKDILAFLLELAAKESKGESITSPGLPGFIGNQKISSAGIAFASKPDVGSGHPAAKGKVRQRRKAGQERQTQG